MLAKLSKRYDLIRFSRRGLGSLGVLAGIVLLAVLVGIRALGDFAPLQIARHQVFDLYQRLSPAPAITAPITIVDIDERSLAALGQWPWPRSLVADLVRKVQAGGAIAMGFDVFFPEADRMSPPLIADQLVGLDPVAQAALREMPANDELFAASLRESLVVLAQAGRQATVGEEPEAGKKAAFAKLGGEPDAYLPTFTGVTRNIPVLETAARGIGVVNLWPEPDGITRRVPVVVNVAGTLVPTLTMEMLRVATGQRTIVIRTDDAGVQSVAMKGAEVPTDGAGRAWVRYSAPGIFPYVSASAVLDGTADPALLSGRLVLIGTSAAGLLDIKTTPVAEFMPGVEIHAHFLNNVLTGTILSRPALMLGAELAMMVLATILVLVLIPRLTAAYTLVLGAGIVTALAGISWYLYTEYSLLLDVTATAFASFTVFALLTAIKYVREEAGRKQVRQTFEQYLAPAVVDQLADNPEQLRLGGENRTLTILFADVRGFTSIAESMDATELTTLINRILTPMTDAVLETGGTVDKYIGDCVMAFWNAPLDDPDHARHACLAALDMTIRLRDLNEELRAEAKAQDGEANPTAIGNISVTTGINTGPCAVGNIGSTHRFDYSVLGDSVNLASRLQGQSGFYQCPIIVGSSTAELSPDLAFLWVDRVKVVGRNVPEDIFTLLGDQELLEDQRFQDLKYSHNGMLAAYFDGEWDHALELLATARGQAKELGLPVGHIYRIFEERLNELKTQPVPADWDGTYVSVKK